MTLWERNDGNAYKFRQVMLTAKVLTEFLQISFSCSVKALEGSQETTIVCFEHNQWDEWEPYAVFAVALGVGVGQVHYMNKAFEYFDALMIIPIFYVWWTVLSIVGGGLVYDDFRAFGPVDYVLFLTGCAIIFSGVIILGTRKPSTPVQEGSKVLPLELVDSYSRQRLAERLLAMQKMQALREKKGMESPGKARPASTVSRKLVHLDARDNNTTLPEDSGRLFTHSELRGPPLTQFPALQLDTIHSTPSPLLAGKDGRRPSGTRRNLNAERYTSQPGAVGQDRVVSQPESPRMTPQSITGGPTPSGHPGYRGMGRPRGRLDSLNKGSSKAVLPPIKHAALPGVTSPAEPTALRDSFESPKAGGSGGSKSVSRLAPVSPVTGPGFLQPSGTASSPKRLGSASLPWAPSSSPSKAPSKDNGTGHSQLPSNSGREDSTE